MVNLDGLYYSEDHQKITARSYFSEQPLSFRTIENGTILPHKNLTVDGKWTWGVGGIVDSKGEFTKESFVNHGCGAPYKPEGDVPYYAETVIYLAMYYPVWGHIITDEMRRVWFFKTEAYKKYFSSCKIIINPWDLSGGGGGITPQFIQLLKILEVDLDKIVIIYKPAKFQNIVLPDSSFYYFFTKEYVETIEQVRNYAQKKFVKLPHKNFLFHYDSDIQVGAERFAKYFSDKGFEVIKPEKFSLDDQLNILANCERFASTVGSCSHNSIFLKDHSEVLLIPRSATRDGYYQNSLDQLHDKNIFYVDSALSAFATQNHGPFCYLISPQLRKFFGDGAKWEKEDFEIFLQYATDSIEKGFEPTEGAKKYYSEVMKYFIEKLKRHGKSIKKFKYLKYLKEKFLW